MIDLKETIKNFVNRVGFKKNRDDGGFSSIESTFLKRCLDCSNFKGPGLVGIRVNRNQRCCQYWCSPSPAHPHRHSRSCLAPPVAAGCWSGKTRQSQRRAQLCQPVPGVAGRGGREDGLEAATLGPKPGKMWGTWWGKCSCAAEPEGTSALHKGSGKMKV